MRDRAVVKSFLMMLMCPQNKTDAGGVGFCQSGRTDSRLGPTAKSSRYWMLLRVESSLR